jgi:hypothetical protein
MPLIGAFGHDTRNCHPTMTVTPEPIAIAAHAIEMYDASRWRRLAGMSLESGILDYSEALVMGQRATRRRG